jgi:hypothetical protein
MGVVLVLGAIFVYLIMYGRQMEQTQITQPIEFIEESTPTPTRVFFPKDLEVTRSEMKSGMVEITNTGMVPYQRIRISIDYLDDRGTLLDTKTRVLDRELPPEGVVEIDIVHIDEIPVETSDSRIKIIHADLGLALN